MVTDFGRLTGLWDADIEWQTTYVLWVGNMILYLTEPVCGQNCSALFTDAARRDPADIILVQAVI